MQKSIVQNKLIFLSVIAFVFILGSTMTTTGQTGECKKPVTLPRLKTNLQNKSFNTKQIVETINDCGADFKLDDDSEQQLVAAGARPQVIEAVRNNYRQPIIVAVSSPKKPAGDGAANVPVTKDRLIKTLKTKSMTNGAILDTVENNGVDFQTTSSVEKELAVAGASPALITAVKNAYRGDRATVEMPVATAANTASNRYQTLVDGALDTYNRDVNANMPAGSAGRLQAIQMMTEATQLQPNNPVAFQQLGYMTLYGTLNGFSAAENNFKKAIELGGSAVLRVYHDHNGTFTQSCNGSLYISKDAVRFESDDNKHTFDVKDDDIKNVKTNSSFVKMFQTKPGSYKIVLKSGDNKNYNFAPLTENNEESKMVVRLIGK